MALAPQFATAGDRPKARFDMRRSRIGHDEAGVRVEDNLASMVLSYLDDADVALSPGDPVGERRLNTCRYVVAAGSVVADGVVEALAMVADELRHRFASDAGPAVFYAWYDQQAGQLRCSLASGSAATLPFTGRYRLTDDPKEVVDLAKASPHPGFIAWQELTADAGDEPEGPPAEPFPRLGRGCEVR